MTTKFTSLAMAGALTLSLAPLFQSAPAQATASPTHSSTTAGRSSQLSEVQHFSFSAEDPHAANAVISRYLRQSNGNYSFDITRARREGASADALAVLQQANSFTQPNNTTETTVSAAASIPVYGNWCGPGHSGPGAPIDDLDTACMHHDQCYSARGYFNETCDRELIAEIRAHYSSMGFKEKVFATAILAVFGVKVAVI